MCLRRADVKEGRWNGMRREGLCTVRGGREGQRDNRRNKVLRKSRKKIRKD